jgi:hypothetical protein
MPVSEPAAPILRFRLFFLLPFIIFLKKKSNHWSSAQMWGGLIGRGALVLQVAEQPDGAGFASCVAPPSSLTSSAAPAGDNACCIL